MIVFSLPFAFVKGLLNGITSGSPNLLPEPRLSTILVLARYHLYAPFRDGLVREPKSDHEIILSQFGLGMGDILTAFSTQEHFIDSPDNPRQPMKLLNTFFRAALYATATEVFAIRGSGSKQSLKQWQARMKKAVDASRLEQTVALFIDHFVQSSNSRIAELEDIWKNKS